MHLIICDADNLFDRSRKSEVGSRKPEVGSRKSEVESRNPLSNRSSDFGLRTSGYFSILSKEATSPFISDELKPLCSISFNPTIVHPFGVVTLSISNSGC